MARQSIKNEVDSLVSKLHNFTDTELNKFALMTSTGVKNISYQTYNGEKTYHKSHDHTNMVVLEKCGDYQVLRYLQFYHRYYVTKPNLNLFEGEVQQVWINTKTEQVVTRTKRVRPFSSYSEQIFILWSDLIYKANNPIYHLDNGYVYIRSLHPTIRQRGLHGKDMHGMSTYHVVWSLLINNDFESLWKRGQFDILEQLNCHYSSDATAAAVLTAAKIVYRNHYVIKDVSLWFDMIDFLRQLGKDLHNAHYVCPENLVVEHNRWQDMLERKRNAERIKREVAEAMKYEPQYAERIAKYLGIMLTNKDFTIHVCGSVREMKEEGRLMHHCVGGYYNKTKSLILLVRGKDGERIATTELKTDTWKIAQTRGKCNKVPAINGVPCKDAIDSLIMANIMQFKKASKTKIIPLNPTQEQPTQVALAA